MNDTTTASPPRCEARTGYTPGAFRLEPVRCDQTRGLRRFVNEANEIHWFCPAPGHMEAVALREGGMAIMSKPR